MNQPVSYLSLVLTAATGAGLLTVYNYIMAEKLQGVKALNNSLDFLRPSSCAAYGRDVLISKSLCWLCECTGGAQPEAVVGKAMVGGPFQLLDHDGEPFTDRDLLGKWALLYFGFTSCPDICPDELDKMTEALNTMGRPQPPVVFACGVVKEVAVKVR